MIAIFCQSPFNSRKPDDLYQVGCEAARAAGMDVHLVDFEALIRDDNIEKALRAISKSSDSVAAVYRGWMMTPDQYLLFYNGLSALGVSLINQPEEYKHCHYLPEWLAELSNMTPETSVLPMKPGAQLTREQIAQSLSAFGADAAIVKDFVKSEKHHWSEACCIPDASNSDQALGVAQHFLQLRGDDLQGGLVFRKFKSFRSVGTHPKSLMPLTEEFRAFILDGKVMTVMNYWDEVEYPGVLPDFQTLLPAVARIPSRFFTVDFARLENGEWIIVELGDGQVSGLPDTADLKHFYDALVNGISL
jgi:hypothetical protein